jgi:CheY-like chemotaxis protein
MAQQDETAGLADDGTVLPATEDFDGERTYVAPLESRQIPVRRTAAPKKVLVVEDNLDSVQTLVLLLQDMGHHVVYAIHGDGALEVAKHMRPDFVLLDLSLPGINGFEVCRRIKADALLQAARVVAVTAYDGSHYRTSSAAAGFDLHLVKPVSPRVLEELLG